MRLKAILHPRGDASRRQGVAVAGLTLLLLTGAGGGALAVAAQVGPAPAAETPPHRWGDTMLITADSTQKFPSGLIRWRGNPGVKFERRANGAPKPHIDAARILIDGKPAPAGLQIDKVDPVTVAWIDAWPAQPDTKTPTTFNIVLKSSEALRQAKYHRADAADYQRFCASDDAGEHGFCAGMIFGAIMKANACLPEGMDVVVAPDRVIPIIAAARPAKGEAVKPLVLSAVRTAFPCPA